MGRPRDCRIANHRAVIVGLVLAITASLAGCAASQRERPDVPTNVTEAAASNDRQKASADADEVVVVKVADGKGVVEVNGAVVSRFDAPDAEANGEVVVRSRPDGTTTVTVNGVRVAEVKE